MLIVGINVCYVPEADRARVTKVLREGGAACLQVHCAKKTRNNAAGSQSFCPTVTQGGRR